MSGARPLRIPEESEIRRAFNRWDRPPAELLDFMFTIGPMVGDTFIIHTIAEAVAHIGSMRNDRKIRHLDNLLSEVNFPRRVAQEINRVIDLVEPPLQYLRAADRIVPPLANLTGAMTRPKNPVPLEAYREAIISFRTLRDQFVQELGYAFVSHIVAHPSHREPALEYAVTQIIERVKNLDRTASVCDFTLKSAGAWETRKVAPLLVVTLLNSCKARDDEVQQMIDNHEPVSAERNVLAIVDDLIIAHCERAITTRSQRMQPFAFWEEVLNNAPPVD